MDVHCDMNQNRDSVLIIYIPNEMDLHEFEVFIDILHLRTLIF